MSVLSLLLVLVQSAAAPDKPQIHWQRNVEDALAIAQDEGRPLLIAVNMDGESASERIVREQYRDPAFVESTRRFVCLAASLFRHSPRDYAPDGTRIPCPRLGEITCGEHIALEPLLFDRYLGGDRIAPRHALIGLDGTKFFDLTLLFDLTEVNRRLVAAQELAPEPAAAPHSRSHAARLALEIELATGDAAAVLERLAGSPDPPALDALRLAWLRPETCERATKIALDRNIGTGAASVVRDLLQDVRGDLLDPSLDADGLLLLKALESLAGESASDRSLVLSYGTGGDPVRRTLLRTDWSVAASVPKPAEPELATEEALEAELSAVEDELSRQPGDLRLEERRGRAARGLARRRLEIGGSSIVFLRGDAVVALARASEARPDDAALLLERARTAYYLSKFEDQERFAQSALKTIPADERSVIQVAKMFGYAHAHEALRWLGDASARLLSARSGGDPEIEKAGIERGESALSLAAIAPTAEAVDWRTLSGFYAALGRRREEIAFALKGLERFPDDQELRAALALALNSSGRPDLLVNEYRRLAGLHPKSAAARWYEGHALIGLADWLRRGEEPDRAIQAYTEGERAFQTSSLMEPAFADSVKHYSALACLGRGFAHLLAERQAEAASELAQGIEILPAIASVRDGLDREAIDLLDGSLEARASGASPVDALALLDELVRADPQNAAWARAISDSQLREALRAAGRGAPEATRAYLERACASGRKAVALGGTTEDRRVLAQAATTFAERSLAVADDATARPLLAEAAPLLGELPPAPAASEAQLQELAARLRDRLGAARPIQRPGR